MIGIHPHLLFYQNTTFIEAAAVNVSQQWAWPYHIIASMCFYANRRGVAALRILNLDWLIYIFEFTLF